MAYATVSDLEARWRPLSVAEKQRAGVLLEDAAVILDAFVDICPGDGCRMKALRQVSCSMVQRAMTAAENGLVGISQQTISADIYSQSMTTANPSGDLYLTSMEKRLLGIGGAYAVSVRPVINPVKVSRHDYWRDC